MKRTAVLLAAGLAATGCAAPGWWPFGGAELAGPAPDLAKGLEVASSDAVYDFYARAQAFYDRLAGRRFNTRVTYEDEFIRDYFRSDQAHADYYADLADALRRAHFERNRPVRLEVLEMRLVGPGDAVVLTRIVGDDGQPLRWWSTTLDREDHWERIDGSWWIVPGPI